MSEWNKYTDDGDVVYKKRKKPTSFCKKNKISSTKYGRCSFSNDKCIYCNRPRKKINKLNPSTGTVSVHYLE